MRIVHECAMCGIEKREVNHWLLMARPAEGSPSFTEWDEKRAAKSECVCGSRCAHAALDAWFNSIHDKRLKAARDLAAAERQEDESNVVDEIAGLS